MPLTFVAGPPCAGGNHWDLSLVGLGGPPIVLPITYQDLLEPLSDEELVEFATLYARFLVSREVPNDMANVRAKLATASIPVRL